ncbi:MAG: leucine-rich repeat domain-containing protein [Candidatus Odinarchaeota archaeon]
MTLEESLITRLVTFGVLVVGIWVYLYLERRKHMQTKKATKKPGRVSRTVTDLICILEDRYQDEKSPDDRKAAIESLVLLGDERAVGPLVKMLEDKYKRCRRAAVIALETLNWQPANQEEEQLFSIEKLSIIAAPLVAALEDQGAEVRQTAAVSLDKLMWEPVTPREKTLYFLAKQAWGELAGLEALDFASLIRLSKISDPNVQKKIIEILETRKTDIQGELSVWGEFMVDLLVNNPSFDIFDWIWERMLLLARVFGLPAYQLENLLEQPLKAAILALLLAGEGDGGEKLRLILKRGLKAMEKGSFLDTDQALKIATDAGYWVAWGKEEEEEENLLTVLDFYNMDLSKLPDTIGKLTCLDYIDLFGNELTALPKSFGNLTRLEHLWLADNQLAALPESFGQLSNLKRIDLDNNRLTILPDSFVNLSKLERLDLSRNRLAALPESFGNLVKLETLRLYNNELTTLPKSFRRLSNLKDLDISGNPLDRAPRGIVKALKKSGCDVQLK